MPIDIGHQPALSRRWRLAAKPQTDGDHGGGWPVALLHAELTDAGDEISACMVRRTARRAATTAGLAIAWRHFRAPELKRCADLWRELKRLGADNRVCASIDTLAGRVVGWLDALDPDDARRYCDLDSSKFYKLPGLGK